MILYSIHWERDPDFPRKDLTKDQKDSNHFIISCLCRSISDAVRCAEWYFGKRYGYSGQLRITDGILRCTRCKIDSRNFNVQYLLLDGMREPFDCVDAKSNFSRIHKMF